MRWRYVIEFRKGGMREVGDYKSKAAALADLAKHVQSLLAHGITPKTTYIEKYGMERNQQPEEAHPKSWDEPEGMAYLEDIQEIMKGGCQAVSCTHDHSTLIMHANCHFKGPTIVVFLKDKPYLLVACDTCKKPIAFIAVARRPKEMEEGEALSE